MIFVDTGAWFASFVPADHDHAAARAWLEANTQELVTTDYVLDELLTLMKARAEFPRALEVGRLLIYEEFCRLEWVTRNDVMTAWQVYATHRDKGWSFTDCISRAVMTRLGIDTAFAFDAHFRQFGSIRVVP